MLLVFFSAENNENLRVRDINQFFAKTTHQAKLRLLRGLFEKSGNGVLDKKTVHVQVYSIFGRASPIWGSLYLISDELLPGLIEVRDLVTEKGEIDQEKLETFKAKNEWLQPDDSVAGQMQTENLFAAFVRHAASDFIPELKNSLHEYFDEKAKKNKTLNPAGVTQHQLAPKKLTYCRYNAHLKAFEWLAFRDNIYMGKAWENSAKSQVFPGL